MGDLESSMKPEILELSFEFGLDIFCPSWGWARRKSHCGLEFCGVGAAKCTNFQGADSIKAPMGMLC